jgi:Zn finger protein HypA/HybF involved in hydrogenase expression
VDEVILDIGPGMEPGVAEAAWAHVVAGTPAAGTRVLWERVTDTLQCFTCSATYHGDKLGLCPDCGGNGLVVEQAPEFSVRAWKGTG